MPAYAVFADGMLLWYAWEDVRWTIGKTGKAGTLAFEAS